MNVDNQPIAFVYTNVCLICVFSTAFMNYPSKYTDLDDPVKEANICDSVLSPKFQQSKLYTHIIKHSLLYFQFYVAWLCLSRFFLDIYESSKKKHFSMYNL